MKYVNKKERKAYVFIVTILTLSGMGGFWTNILKCSEGEGAIFFFFFFFILTSATKRFAKSRIFRYGLSLDFLEGCIRIKTSN